MTPPQKSTEKPSSSKPTDPAAPRVPCETLLAALPAWEAAAVRAHANWPAGREVTQAEFEEAHSAALKEVIR
ncbi:hypothetical protein [Deinococcus sp. 6GRE01]|uniref:hypothetical protein n=1 Tax=Deinococcus sp. 6GRE01 TaxID=2745873 RepID=UPI001E4D8535|nr:hypothetical protein [Deinococcus sp. 6GRE01]MCD0156014.1 hypothetical protein [Deinococcus sp. 6GRE01]